jgi:hypothetical protein
MTIAIDQLRIAHWPGNPATLARADAQAFVLDTCLRRLSVTLAPMATADAAPEQRAGAAAYQLLLEVITGLQSAVPGETNVLGQFKRAWAQYRQQAPATAAALAPIVEHALRDTRAVRQRHLQNIGGASYGPLVRRLLRAGDRDRVLFVGAGDLARSMLPFFTAFELGTWNRSLPGPQFPAAGRVFAPADGGLAAGWAHHVVLTTPADPVNDARWSSWLAGSLVQTVVHLGQRRGDEPVAPAHALGYDLDDVFDLRRSQDKIRSLQIERARHECRERARRLADTGGAAARQLATG